MRASLLAALLLASQVQGASGQAPGQRTTLGERERAIHLLNRATYGARPEDVDEVLRIGRDAWIDRQMNPAALERRLIQAGPVTVDVASSAGVATRLIALDGGGSLINPPLANKLVRAVGSRRQLEQVMTDFWFDHFSVTTADVISSALVSYEDTIRSHVFGRFRDLIGATARHPALLIYLENYRSGSPPAGSPPGTRSLDERFARALLELHTLGPAGGYTEDDVTTVARAFTGWSVPLETLRQPSGADDYRLYRGDHYFVYRPQWHDAAEKVVLGRKLTTSREGDEVLDLLAGHPATARHVATKLVRRFVAEDPPAELVDELARVFLATDGDLAAVTRALFTSERFYDPSSYRAKARRPFELTAAALRLTNAALGRSAASHFATRLSAMEHAPYHAPTAAGYPTWTDAWGSPEAVIQRAELAVMISNGGAAQVDDPAGQEPLSIDPWRTAGLDRAQLVQLGPVAAAREAAAAIVSRLAQGAPSDRLRAEATRELAGLAGGDDPDAALRRAIALVLGSPEFQRY